MESILFIFAAISCFALSVYLLGSILSLSFIPTFFGSTLAGIVGATTIFKK